MNKQAVFNWLKRNPWVVVPLLGLIPLVSLSAANRQTPSPSPQTSPQTSLSPTAILPSPVAVSPQPSAIAPSPQATASPVAKSVPNPVKASPSPVAVDKKPVTPGQKRSLQAVKSAVSLSVDSAIPMRVLVNANAAELRVGTSAGGDVIDVKTGKRLHYLPPQSAYTTQASGDVLLLGSLRLPSLIWIDPANGGVTYVGDRAYRGRILLVGHENRLWAVNHVNMQQYLHSVVGSEVSPSWPMEALKAQAVAARSYALTYHLKPVNRDLYDLGNDEYFQVYKGIESEAPTTRQAVNSTSGEFVSYRGGVVESLYAATDDIVMEAFQGKGMSQIGALGMAEKGYGYRQILGSYYTGTGIARIEMDVE